MAEKRIDVTEDGPYEVSGEVPVTRLEIEVDASGESVGWRELQGVEHPDPCVLCRCGKSATKPFCDGSHVLEDFDGTETAGHGSFQEQAVSIEGPGMLLRDVRVLCAEARFCDHAGGLWNLIERCDDPDTMELVKREASLCPSGRYVAAERPGETPVEPELEPSIALIEDPQLDVSGPLFVRGGVPIFDADGVPYEVRNRVTLCRCGASRNKPFCDGSHIEAGFKESD